MSERIVIEHKCDVCGIVVYSQAQDKIIGHVSKGHPKGWEHVNEKWLCVGCAQNWHEKLEQAWNAFLAEKKQKNKTTTNQ